MKTSENQLIKYAQRLEAIFFDQGNIEIANKIKNLLLEIEDQQSEELKEIAND